MPPAFDPNIKGFRATKRLVSERRMQGLSQSDLARKLATKPPSISRWENGVSIMRATTAKRVARALGMTIEEAVERKVFRAVKA